jgi:ribonuclease HI
VSGKSFNNSHGAWVFLFYDKDEHLYKFTGYKTSRCDDEEMCLAAVNKCLELMGDGCMIKFIFNTEYMCDSFKNNCDMKRVAGKAGNKSSKNKWFHTWNLVTKHKRIIFSNHSNMFSIKIKEFIHKLIDISIIKACGNGKDNYLDDLKNKNFLLYKLVLEFKKKYFDKYSSHVNKLLNKVK